jgi:hypothetical protein
MPFFSDIERASLSIEQMIFHIVGPIEEPILLEKLAASDALHSFFLDRILSGTTGNRYEFRASSATEACLKAIDAKPSLFAENSKALARDFHRHHRQTASSGAFMVFQLATSGESPVFALLKYDDDQAIEYDYDIKDGRNEAKLRFLERTFVRKPEAMQKLALVRLGSNAGQLAVRDRSHRDGISEYFQKFLDVRRVQEEAGMTEKLQIALQETVREFRQSLPPEVRKMSCCRFHGHRV